MGIGLWMGEDNERRAWGSVPAELHRIAVDEYERTGLIPSAQSLADLAQMHPTLVRRTLKQLCDAGLLAQPQGERSGYIPLRRPDGARVKPVLVVVSEDSLTVEAVPPGRSPEEVERALELLDAARQLMEVAAGRTPEEVKRALELLDAARRLTSR